MSNKVEILSLDKETLLAEAKSKKNSIPELAPWNFENQNDVLRFVLDFYLESLERTGAWANALSQEFSIGTALSRDNVIRHAVQLGYEPSGRVGADVNITVDYDPIDTNQTIEAHQMRISASGPDGGRVYFENKENFTLLSTAQQVTDIPFVEGRSKTKEFNSNGLPFQTFTITDEIIQDSLVVLVDGVEWQEVDSFEGVSSTEERFRLRTLNQTTQQIIFGDGSKGKIPAEGKQIIVEYRHGGGVRGNVHEETISQLEEDPTGVITEVTNPTGASGGTDPESTEQIRNNAVRLPRLNNRIVTLRDMERFGDAYNGVSRTSSFPNFNSPLVYIIPDGKGTPSTGLLEDLQEDMNEIVVLGHFVSVLPPQYKTVDLEVGIVYNPAYKRSSVETNVTNVLNNLLDPLFRFESGVWAREFGDPLKVSEVAGVVRNVEGVMAVEIISPEPTPGSDILVSCEADEILTDEGSTITISSTKNTEYEGAKNRSVKSLHFNPKYQSE